MGDWDRFCDSYGLDFYTDPVVFSEKENYSSYKNNSIKYESRNDFLFLSFQDALSFLRQNRKDKHGVPRIIRRLNINTNKNHDFFICLSIRESYDYDIVDDSIPSVIYDLSTEEYIDSAIPKRFLSKYGISDQEEKYRMFSSWLFLKSHFRNYSEFKYNEIIYRKREHALDNERKEQERINSKERSKPRQLEDGSWIGPGYVTFNTEMIYDQIYNEARK